MSDQSQGPGWWVASDGKWYPPEQHPNYTPAPSSSHAMRPVAGLFRNAQHTLNVPAGGVVFREGDMGEGMFGSSTVRSNFRRRSGSSPSSGPTTSSARWRSSTPLRAWRPPSPLPTPCWRCSTSTASFSWYTRRRHSRFRSCQPWLIASGHRGGQIDEAGNLTGGFEAGGHLHSSHPGAGGRSTAPPAHGSSRATRRARLWE